MELAQESWDLTSIQCIPCVRYSHKYLYKYLVYLHNAFLLYHTITVYQHVKILMRQY